MLNKVIVIGRVGADPTLKEFSNGNQLCQVNLAISDSYKNNNGDWVDNPIWVTVKMISKFAIEAGQKIKKGDNVLVEGKLSCEKWDDKDGNKRERMVITAYGMRNLSYRKQHDKGSKGGDDDYTTDANDASTTATNDDLPF